MPFISCVVASGYILKNQEMKAMKHTAPRVALFTSEGTLP